MRWIIGLLIALPAWAQEPDCNMVTKELAMRPPAYGDAGRANYDWQSYVGFCEHVKPWEGMVGPEDIQALSKLLHPEVFK